MGYIVIVVVGFLLFYSLTYSKSENKRKNQHKKYMSMIREEKNSDKNNYQWAMRELHKKFSFNS